jgi:hypothetical protein
MPDLTFRDLRAPAGAGLVTAGADVKTAQARLGHAYSANRIAAPRKGTARGGPTGRR